MNTNSKEKINALKIAIKAISKTFILLILIFFQNKRYFHTISKF